MSAREQLPGSGPFTRSVDVPQFPPPPESQAPLQPGGGFLATMASIVQGSSTTPDEPWAPDEPTAWKEATVPREQLLADVAGKLRSRLVLRLYNAGMHVLMESARSAEKRGKAEAADILRTLGPELMWRNATTIPGRCDGDRELTQLYIEVLSDIELTIRSGQNGP